MKCPRCGNEDEKFIGIIQGKKYCRKCVQFKRQFLDEKIEPMSLSLPLKHGYFHLDFTLNSKQAQISRQLVENYQAKHNSYIWAVCGSGKTEICFEIISYVLNLGQRVCFALPRRSLCQEMYERFHEANRGYRIGMIMGGKSENKDAELLIVTTHQLYRFISNPFDLMIIDEVDAFPFYKDEVLQAIFLKACKQYIKMSATITANDIHDEKVYYMNRRYHQYDLPVPKIKVIPKRFYVLFIKRYKLKHPQSPLLVYVPLKKQTREYKAKLSVYFRVEAVSSESPNIKESLDKLKTNQYDILVTTTILERGITIKDVQVIVLDSHHYLYNWQTLVQICGRVGRKIGYEKGDIYFLSQKVSKDMKECLKVIKKLNKMTV